MEKLSKSSNECRRSLPAASTRSTTLNAEAEVNNNRLAQSMSGASNQPLQKEDATQQTNPSSETPNITPGLRKEENTVEETTFNSDGCAGRIKEDIQKTHQMMSDMEGEFEEMIKAREIWWKVIEHFYDLDHALKKASPNIRISFQKCEGHFYALLQGPETAVAQAKRKFQTLDSKLKRKYCDLFVTSIFALSELQLESYLDNHLSTEKIHCVTKQKKGKIYVYGFDDKQLSEAVNAVGEVIVEKEFIIQDYMRNKVEALVPSLKQKWPNKIVMHTSENGSLHIVGIKQYVKEAYETFSGVSGGEDAVKEFVENISRSSSDKCPSLNEDDAHKDGTDIVNAVANRNKMAKTGTSKKVMNESSIDIGPQRDAGCDIDQYTHDRDERPPSVDVSVTNTVQQAMDSKAVKKDDIEKDAAWNESMDITDRYNEIGDQQILIKNPISELVIQTASSSIVVKKNDGTTEESLILDPVVRDKEYKQSKSTNYDSNNLSTSRHGDLSPRNYNKEASRNLDRKSKQRQRDDKKGIGDTEIVSLPEYNKTKAKKTMSVKSTYDTNEFVENISRSSSAKCPSFDGDDAHKDGSVVVNAVGNRNKMAKTGTSKKVMDESSIDIGPQRDAGCDIDHNTHNTHDRDERPPNVDVSVRNTVQQTMDSKAVKKDAIEKDAVWNESMNITDRYNDIGDHQIPIKKPISELVKQTASSSIVDKKNDGTTEESEILAPVVREKEYKQSRSTNYDSNNLSTSRHGDLSPRNYNKEDWRNLDKKSKKRERDDKKVIGLTLPTQNRNMDSKTRENDNMSFDHGDKTTNIVTESVLLDNRKMKRFLMTTKGRLILKECADENYVTIEQNTHQDTLPNKVTVKEHLLLYPTGEYSRNATWKTKSQKELLLVAGNEVERVPGSAVSVTFIPNDAHKESKVASEGKRFVLPVPSWSSGKAKNYGELVDEFTTCVTEMELTKVEHAVVSLENVKKWPGTEFYYFVTDLVVKHSLLNETTTRPHTVTLLLEDGSCFDRLFELINTTIRRKMKAKLAKRNELKAVVVSGEMNKQKADVIVNTTSSDLDLTKGKVSESLLKAAGGEIQDECSKLHPRGISHMEVAVTGGYRLHCEKVFHIALDRYLPENEMHSIETIRSLMTMCLWEASELNFDSIAFPAIGTGVLRYPVELVAAVMFESVERFKQRNEDTSLKTVLFVIYPNDVKVMEVFKRHEESLQETEEKKSDVGSSIRLDITGNNHDVTKAKHDILDRCEDEVTDPNEIQENIFNGVTKQMYIALCVGHYLRKFETDGLVFRHQDDVLRVEGKRHCLKKSSIELKSILKNISKLHFASLSVRGYDLVAVERELRTKYEAACYLDRYHELVRIYGETTEATHHTQNDLQMKLGNCGLPLDSGNKENGNEIFKGGSPKKFEYNLHENGSLRIGRHAAMSDIKNRQMPVDEKMKSQLKESDIDTYCVISDNPNHTSEYSFDSFQSEKTQLSKETVRKDIFQVQDVMVYVYEADILRLKVDCIVNPANAFLQHGGGLAEAISKAAGSKLKKECDKIIKTKGPQLAVASVELTTAGRLPYNCVLHAVGPCWDHYRPITDDTLMQCQADLKNTVVNCLEQACNNGLTSIAIPAISSGSFRVPKEICALEYSRAVLEFLKQKTILKEIHIVDMNRNMIDLIQSVFTTAIHYKKPTNIDTSVYVEAPRRKKDFRSTGRSKGATTQAIMVNANTKIEPQISKADFKSTGRSRRVTTQAIMENTNTKIEAQRSKTDFKSTVKSSRPKAHISIENPNTKIEALKQNPSISRSDNYTHVNDKLICNFTEQHTVLIYSSDILHLQGISAIVCCVDRSGREKCAVSRGLLQMNKGSKYQEVKARCFKEKRNIGDVISTPVGNSNFSHILHVVSPHKDYKALRMTYLNLFDVIVRLKIRCIAMPLLSTDNDTFEVKDTTILFISEMIGFTKKHKIQPVEIHLVLDDVITTKDVKAIFMAYFDDQTKFQNLLDTPTEPEKRTKNDTSSDTNADIALTSGKGHQETWKDCVICIENITEPKKLKCGHEFCTKCIDGYFRVKPACPVCGQVCGVITGDQPDGKMEITKLTPSCAGYEGYKSIAVSYHFPHGIQNENHPRPGAFYRSISRTGYLPDSKEGRQICAMLKAAFERRLVFTIGTSRTTGEEGVITWNDIHHKTDLRPNTQFGYPDKSYLQRVRDELEVKSVTSDDIDTDFIKKLAQKEFRFTVTTDTAV